MEIKKTYKKPVLNVKKLRIGVYGEYNEPDKQPPLGQPGDTVDHL